MPDWNHPVKENVLYRDLMVFLRFVEAHSPTLTETKNIKLQWLPALNDLLVRKQAMEEKLGDHLYRVRSENDMPSIRAMDFLCEAMQLTTRRKGKLMIVQKHKSFFDTLSPHEQLILIWHHFTHQLDWTYIQYLENDARIAAILQVCQDRVWRILWEAGVKTNNGHLSLTRILNTIRENLGIQWITAHGDDPDLARWGIRHVIFDRGLVFLGLARWNKSEDMAEILPLGKDIISREIATSERVPKPWKHSNESLAQDDDVPF